MNNTILVVAAHSDDDALGCSGTIVRHVSSGDEVHVLYMTDGVASRGDTNGSAEKRSQAAHLAAEIMGISSVTNLSFPDNRLDSVPLLDVVKEIEKKLVEIKPDIIYTNHQGDLNIDHRTTFKAVVTACRPIPGTSVREIYSFEVLSSTEWGSAAESAFFPNVFVDITPFIDVKKKVLDAYIEEMREEPHSRSTVNAIRQSALRGNSVGIAYAESFQLVRKLV